LDNVEASNKRRIYVMKGLSPEVVAVTFAKTSRSPKPFDEIAKELTEEKSSQFHERWVVGYGHSSVAEHAVLSIAIENVSILATKVIDDNRLASFTEKSTRYQSFDKNRYHKPKKIMASALSKIYVQTADFLMDNYLDMLSKMIAILEKKYPRGQDEPENIYQIRIKNLALDSCRYMLPAATLTNLGMTINARNLEYAIVKLFTHPLEEMQEIGEEIKSEALKVTPTLVKYTSFNKYFAETSEEMQNLAKAMLAIKRPKNQDGAVLVDYDRDAEEKLVSALLYRVSKYPYQQIKKIVKKMSPEAKAKVIDEALNRLGKFDRPFRELEHIYYTFDILMDYGAFRDVQRHRMCTQTNQDLTIEHGYIIPQDIIEAGLQEQYEKSMKKAAKAYKEISKELPSHAAYIVPLAYKKRTLFTWNLRELFHFIKLRSGKMGHESYRKLAQQMYNIIAEKQPLLAKYIAVDKS
jgi:thymidylate synthase ThyX